MKKDLNEFPLDSVILSDTWDDFQYHICNEIKNCDYEKIGAVYSKIGFPFLRSFEIWIEKKLIKAGFKKETIRDEVEFDKLIYVLNFEQMRKNTNWNFDLNPPYGFPAGTYKVSKDSHSMWINSDIEAALLTLESIKIIRGLLVTNGVVNKKAVKVYLRTLEMTVNLTRAGNIADIAKAKYYGEEKSLKTRNIKQTVMKSIIDNIFQQKPKTPKTLGGVWNKLDQYGCIRLCENEKFYVSETGKNKNGKDVVIIKGYIEKPQKDANGKDIQRDTLKPFVYSKRSLQHFIDKLK